MTCDEDEKEETDDWSQSRDLLETSLLNIAKNKNTFPYEDLGKEYPYVRGIRHGIVAGVRRALQDPDFIHVDGLDENHELYQTGYEAGIKSGQYQAQREHRQLIHLLREHKKVLEEQTQQLKDEKQEAYEKGFIEGKAEGGEWNLT
jgi:hypothetical protein